MLQLNNPVNSTIMPGGDLGTGYIYDTTAAPQVLISDESETE
jgi:hypothetical protein